MINTLLVGIVTGIGVAVVLASLFSMTVQGQMMQHQGIQAMQQDRGSAMTHSMFSANGLSMVQDVRISGVSITGDNEISVSLVYIGNETAPSVTLIAMTNHMAMMDIMMGGYGGNMGGMSAAGITGMNSMGNMGMMAGHNMMGSNMPVWNDPGMSTWNATQWRNWHSQMMAQSGWSSVHFAPPQSQTGSSLADTGWQSGSIVKVKLDGDTSAYSASDLHVIVFPHLT